MKLTAITIKQQEILELLYSYRFLNRIQIQALMNHKDYRRINAWLKDLREKHCVEWIYSTDFAEKTKPAIYYIGINGVRYLKTLQSDDDTPVYPLEEVRKRYRESSRSQTYRDRCQQLADCVITLGIHSNNGDSDIPSKERRYATEADYLNPSSPWHFLADSELIQPHLWFMTNRKKKGQHITTNYLLEIFDPTFPRYRIKKRLKDYVEFLDDGEWQSETGDDRPPIVLLVCPRTSDLIYVKRRTRGLLADIQDRDTEEEDRLHMRFATIDNLRALGVTGEIWEAA